MPGQGTNWWVDSFPASVPGGTVYGNGGGGYAGTDMLAARDPLDAKRMAAGFAPGASYPDGYLGFLAGDRQQDKVLGALQTRMTPTSYQRGVHKGGIVGAQAYFWNEDMNPDAGLARESAARAEDIEGGVVLQVKRFAPTGNPVELLAHGGKTAGMTDREQEAYARSAGADPAKNPVTITDPARALRMRQNLPRWSGVFQA